MRNRASLCSDRLRPSASSSRVNVSGVSLSTTIASAAGIATVMNADAALRFSAYASTIVAAAFYISNGSLQVDRCRMRFLQYLIALAQRQTGSGQLLAFPNPTEWSIERPVRLKNCLTAYACCSAIAVIRVSALVRRLWIAYLPFACRRMRMTGLTTSGCVLATRSSPSTRCGS